MRRTAARRASRRGTRRRVPGWSAPTRSRSTRTSGSSRRTTSAGCWSARRVRRPRSGAEPRVLPRRRDPRGGVPACRRRAHDGAITAITDDHADQLNFYKLGFEGTRRWRALKLWITWKHLGTRVRPAHRGERRPGRVPRGALRRAATSRRAGGRSCRSCASATCPGRGAARAGAATRRPPGQAQAALEASGDGWLTTTRLRGATWLRAGIVNYLATEDDIDLLLGKLRRLAD